MCTIFGGESKQSYPSLLINVPIKDYSGYITIGEQFAMIDHLINIYSVKDA